MILLTYRYHNVFRFFSSYWWTVCIHFCSVSNAVTFLALTCACLWNKKYVMLCFVIHIHMHTRLSWVAINRGSLQMCVASCNNVFFLKLLCKMKQPKRLIYTKIITHRHHLEWSLLDVLTSLSRHSWCCQKYYSAEKGLIHSLSSSRCIKNH